MTKALKRNQHCHFATRVRCELNRVAAEGISKTAPIGRIRDDVAGEGSRFSEKIAT